MSTAARRPRPRGSLASQDLLSGQAVVLAVVALAVVIVLELLVEGRLGLLFGVAFVLVAWSVPLTVRPGGFFVAGVLPPLLMTAVVVGFGLAAPDRLHGQDVEPGASAFEHVLAGFIDHATPLVVAQVGALLVLALRAGSTTASRS
jgi:hypothetical protein